MQFEFGALKFDVFKDKIALLRCALIQHPGYGFVEVQIAGENKDTHLGAKMARSSEGRRLQYVSHTQTENRLVIIQRSPLVEVQSVFEKYPDTNAIRTYTVVKNISNREIILEEVSAFTALKETINVQDGYDRKQGPGF